MKKNAAPKRRRWPIVLLAILAVLIAVAVANHNLIRMIFYSNCDPLQPLNVEGDWAGGTTYRNVAFASESENQYLNLYVPDAETPPRLIVLVHGGGFISNDCESRQAQLFYQYFRDHGYACATVNYRLAQEASFPAALEDVKCAVRFLKANAETYGYAADRVAIWGESAGGYLAVMASVTSDGEFNDLPFIGEDALAEKVSAKIDACVDYYGAVQLETKQARNAAFARLGVPAFVVDIANSWLTVDRKEYPGVETCEDLWIGKRIEDLTAQEYGAIQPETYVRRNLKAGEGPKMLIRHGDADLTVPYTQSQNLFSWICETRGEGDCELEIVHNAKHADENMYSDADLSRVAAWLGEALKE